jgi:ABC-type amino acid transport substrate-binding protein/heat shock protein HslJ
MQRSNMRPIWTLAALLLIAALVTACQPLLPRPFGSNAPEAAAPAAPASTPTAPLALPDPAADWQKIADKGVIVVGTSANYRPFEYFDADFQYAGFDMALLRAVAEELGVEVVFRDVAFEGLFDALKLGQIDAVVAALSATPERARLVDFSDAYFVSSEGILAAAGSTLAPITAVEQLADLRLGVETGSIFEAWINAVLVADGVVDAQNVIRYNAVDAAVAGLADGRVDLVITDLPSAQVYVDRSLAQLAGEGNFFQNYAIAVRQGSEELRTQLNQALQRVQARGIVARLAEEHMGLTPDKLLPVTLLDLSGGVAPEAPACIDGLAWVADLSYDDQNMAAPSVFVPGQPFAKSWRVQNVGNCTWDDSYQLAFAYGTAPGASMGSQPVAVQGTVAPGAAYDIQVDMVAPLTAGTLRGVWHMTNGAGRAFGEGLFMGAQVAGAPTPTPAPTQTPSPGITFYTDKERILQGEPVTLYWQVEGADAVYFFATGETAEELPVAAEGQLTDFPNQTTVYYLRVLRSGGEETREITVYVDAVAGLPQIEYFDVSPEQGVTMGQCLTLAWRVSADAEFVTIFRDGETLWDGAPLEGTLEDCPETVGLVEYAVGARNGVGVNYAVDIVAIGEAKAAADAAAAAPAAPAGPTIASFAVTPDAVAAGGCVAVNWTVVGDIANVRILRDDVVLLDGGANTGSGADCLLDLGVFTYQLEATDTAGAVSTAEATVKVGSPAGSSDALNGSYVVATYRTAAGAQASPIAETQITADFNNGALSGNGGCNAYSGAYSAADGAISVMPLAVTMMMCVEPEGVAEQEAAYLAALQEAAFYTLDGGQLTLADAAGAPLVVFVVQ